MKIRKIKVTENNIYALAGRINKFFGSLSEEGGYEYETTKWCHKYGNSYHFYKGGLEIRVDEITKQPIIHLESPVRDNIRVGDYIHLDGNHFIYKSKYSGYYRIYNRSIIKRYNGINKR